MAVIDELVTLLGLEIDPKATSTAEKYGAIIGKVTTVAVAAGTALIAAATAVNAFAASQAAAIHQTGEFADRIGVSFERLQELEYAAEKSGGSINDLRGDLEKFSKLRPGDPVETLLRAADRMQGMSRRGQMRFAEMIGISPGTLKLIQQGREGIEQLTKRSRELGLILDNTAKERAAKAVSAFTDFRNVIGAVGRSIAAELLPNITRGTNAVTGWVVENSKWIRQGLVQLVDGVSKGFEMVGNALGKVVGWVKQLISPFGKFVEGLDASQPIAIAVATALGVLTLAMIPFIAGLIAANLPIIIMTAAIAALVLAIDDLYAFFNGGDSIIGGWVKSFTDAYPNIAAWVKDIGGLFVDLAVWIATALLRAAGHVIDAIEMILPVVGKIIGGAVDLITGFYGIIEDLIAGKNPFEGLITWFSEIGTRLKEMALNLGKNILSGITGGLGSLGESLVNALGGGYAMSATVGASANVPAGNLAGGGTVNNTINQNISGAGDPRAVGQEAANRSGMGVALQQLRPGMSGPTVG